MPNVLLGVTGSVAAIRVPMLFAALRERGFAVKIVATRAATYFFDTATIEPADPASPVRNPQVVTLDEDEWPGRDSGKRWERDEPVTHIELRRWADLYLIAPLDANTLAKLANGLCDNCLTSVWRAWDPAKPVVLAPAMNTLMWEHALTRRHLRQLAQDSGLVSPADYLNETGLVTAINRVGIRLRIVEPQKKTLACGDVGMGAMAEVESIIAAVQTLLPVSSEDESKQPTE